jgi:uncharacterized protein YmfQ (DUF2313 family)
MANEINQELIKSALLALLPDGEIHTIAPDEDYDKLLDGLAQNWEIITGFAENTGNVRAPEKTAQLDELEREFGVPDPALPEETRRTQLTAVKYENTQGNGSFSYIQEYLNEAGFDVQVHHNDPSVDPALFPGDILVNGRISYTAPAYEMQCAGANAFCGNNNAVCGFFKTFYTTDVIYELPTDPDAWPFIFFVGGDATRDGSGYLTSIAPADVYKTRKNRFLELILKSKPWFDWAVLIVNYTINLEDIQGLKLDLNALNWMTSITKDGGDKISEFRDDSGQGNKAVQAAPAAQPLFVLSAINGKPGVRFDGINYFFDLIDILPNERDFTLYAVLRLPNPITSSPEVAAQIIFGTQNITTEPRADVRFGNASGGLTGETLTFTAVKTSTPSPIVSFGYLNEDIAAGVYVIKIKLSGETLSISLNETSKTVNVENFPPEGSFGPDRTLKNINRIGRNADGFGDYLAADLGRCLYWDRALGAQEDADATELLINEWS